MILSTTEYTPYIKAFIGVLAIVNPLGAIPIFLSLCSDQTPEEYCRTAFHSALAVALILLSATWAGDSILGFFGIGIPAFQAGGGLLIVLMAINMLHAKHSHTQHTQQEVQKEVDDSDREGVAIVPLAIPLMAGPGAISLVIIDSHQVAHWTERFILSGSIVIVACIVWVSLHMALPIGQKMGVTGLNIATRIMGLLLAAIGVQMLTTGLKMLLPGLA